MYEPKRHSAGRIRKRSTHSIEEKQEERCRTILISPTRIAAIGRMRSYSMIMDGGRMPTRPC